MTLDGKKLHKLDNGEVIVVRKKKKDKSDKRIINKLRKLKKK